MLKKVWRKNSGNSVLPGNGFYISYNPATDAVRFSGLLTDIANTLGSNVEDGEETALIKNENPQIYSILSGDHRRAYEKVIDKGYEACYEVFKKLQPKHGNNWSSRDEDRKF